MADEHDRDYGPDTEMPQMGKAMITSIVAHKDCLCETIEKHGLTGPCSRCSALDYIKQHWPWWYFTTIGNMGVSSES
jgi:hypothetical protein